MTGGRVTQQSLAKASILVGKALQDPIKGLGSLRRVGVAFTADEQARIKALVASGKTMEAQKLILAELNKEFGGSAAALGGTLPGKINIMRESFKNLGGTLAIQLVPSITRAVESLNKFVTNVQNQQAIIGGFKTGIGAVSTIVKTLSGAFRVLSTVLGGNRNALLLLIGVYVTFKALKVASTVAGMARNFGILTARTKGATAATSAFRLGMVGKAGILGATLAASFGITTMFLKLTGLDKKLRGLGRTAFDVAAKLGLVNDPGAQFAGKRNLSQAESGRLRRTAGRLQAAGLTPNQSAAQLIRQNPSIAARDIRVLSGAASGRGVPLQATINVDGQAIAKVTTEAQRKAQKRNTTQRRGRISGR
jgi:hypothetical protein